MLEVNKLVLQGVPFRDAYKQIGNQIENNTFHADTQLNHVHEGSMGNLCNPEIIANFIKVLNGFNFSNTAVALQKLLSDERPSK